MKVHGFVSISGFTSPVTNKLFDVGENLNLSLGDFVHMKVYFTYYISLLRLYFARPWKMCV